jgi:hypothetical protein
MTKNQIMEGMGQKHMRIAGGNASSAKVRYNGALLQVNKVTSQRVEYRREYEGIKHATFE